MKNTLRILSLLLALVTAAGLLAGCAVLNASADDLTYVTLRINPEIELVADKDDTVVAVSALNEDGEILLTDVDPVGMSLEDAAAAFVDSAAALGYLDVDAEDGSVFVDAVGKNDKHSDKVKTTLSEKLTAHLEKKGVKATVSAETPEKYAAEADAWGISYGQAKLVLRVLELYPEMDADEALALSVKERKQLVRDASDESLTLSARKAAKEAVEILKTEKGVKKLKEDIIILRVKSKAGNLSGDDKAVLKSRIKEMTNELKELTDSIRAEAKALREASRKEADEERAELETIKEEKKQQNAEKVKAHEEKVRAEKAEAGKSVKTDKTGKAEKPVKETKPAGQKN